MTKLTGKMRRRAARTGTVLWGCSHQQALAILDGHRPAPDQAVSAEAVARAYAARHNDPQVVAAAVRALWVDPTWQLQVDDTLTGTLRDDVGTTLDVRCHPGSWALTVTGDDTYRTPARPDVDWSDASEAMADPLAAAHHWLRLLQDAASRADTLALCG